MNTSANSRPNPPRLAEVRDNSFQHQADLDAYGHSRLVEAMMTKEVGDNYEKEPVKAQANPREEIEANWARIQKTKFSDAILQDLACMYKYATYLEPNITAPQVYAAFLEIPSTELHSLSDNLSSFKGRILRYALNKTLNTDQVPFRLITVSAEINGKKIGLPTGAESMQQVQISATSHVNLPSYFHYGVIEGGKSKPTLILELVPTPYGGYTLNVTYAHGQESSADDLVKVLKTLIEKHNFYRGQALSPDGAFLNIVDASWDKIYLEPGLQEDILCNIRSIFEKEEILLKNGVNAKRGIIMSGPPGTGKTLFAKCLAQELRGKVTFIWVTPKDVGWPERMRGIYDLAQELSPAVVFLEDADIYLVNRETAGAYGGNSILGELMQCLDGFIPLRGIVTILTSNRPEVLEGALSKRPGRFDRNYRIDAPSDSVRQRMITDLFAKAKLDPADLTWLVGVTKCFTGAEMAEVYKYSVIKAVDRNAVDKDQIAHPNRTDLADAVGAVSQMKSGANATSSTQQPEERAIPLGKVVPAQIPPPPPPPSIKIMIKPADSGEATEDEESTKEELDKIEASKNVRPLILEGGYDS